MTSKKPARLKPVPPAPADEVPDHLQPETAAWVASVLRDFELEEHHVRILILAGEAWDRAAQAREQLAAEGITFIDRLENVRKHPAVSIEENARLAFARLIRELDLEGETLPAPRPPARANRRR